MSQRIRSNKNKRSRGFTYLWIFGLAVSVFLLIYFEQTSLLYILATLGVTILLVIVATADLGQSERSSEATAQMSEASSPPSGAKARK
jgi:ABC-type protease/lipase transport system fused ATPase/permease subunit